MTGLEPVTSSLPRKCSTAELHWQSASKRHRCSPLLWVRMDSNHRRQSQQIYSLPHLATLVHTLLSRASL